MMKTTLTTCALLLLLLAAVTSAGPRFLALQQQEQERDQLGCSIDELLRCSAEIEKAMADCGHLATTEDIMVCVNDILGAIDCEVSVPVRAWFGPVCKVCSEGFATLLNKGFKCYILGIFGSDLSWRVSYPGIGLCSPSTIYQKI